MESAASSLNKSMLSFLPTMGAGEALLMGVDFSMPLLLKITPPVKTPRSETPILKEMIFGCNKGCKSRNSLIYTLVCGERGIRTPGASQHDGFQDRCNRPLYHLSNG